MERNDFLEQAVVMCRKAADLLETGSPAALLIERLARAYRKLARNAGDRDLPADGLVDLERAAEALDSALQLIERDAADDARPLVSAAEQRLATVELLIDSAHAARQATP